MGSSWRRGILLRLFLLGAGAAGFGLLLAETRHYVVSTLTGGVLIGLILDFVRLSRSADRDLVRVI
ncbi:MAG: hypothetical protein QOJ54_1094, partial [Aliidongia sp.]|nr:hypothetical protein [Aliidongia sp.]